MYKVFKVEKERSYTHKTITTTVGTQTNIYLSRVRKVRKKTIIIKKNK